MRPRSLVLAALLASCAAPPPPPAVVTVTPPTASATAPPPGPCDVAAGHRARVKALLDEGRLQRAIRVIAHADKLCPATAAESAAQRAAAKAELDRDPAASADALVQAGRAATDKAEAQRLFDRALAALERAGGRVTLDAPNGLGDIHGAVIAGAGKSAYLAVAHGKRVSICDPETGRERTSLPIDRDAESLAASPDGKWLAAGTMKGVYVWEVPSGRVALRIEGMRELVAWSADGKTMIVGDTAAPAIEVWSAESMTAKRTLVPKPPPPGEEKRHLSSVAVSARGDTVAAGLGDGTVTLFRASDGKVLREIRAHKERARSVALSPDGKLLATASMDEAHVFRVATGKRLSTLGKVYWAALAWSHDGRRVAIPTIDGISWHGADTGKEVQHLEGRLAHTLALDPSGARLVTTGTQRVAVWDVERGAERVRIEKHAEAVSAAAWAPGGSAVITGDWDDRIHVWDLEKGAPRRTLKDEDTIRAVAVSPDGKLLASATTEPATTLWDLETGAKIHVFPAQRGWNNAVAFSKSGRLLAWGAGERVNVAEVAARNVVQTFGPLGTDVISLAIHPDEETIAAGTQGSTLHLLQVATGKEVAQEKLSNAVSSLAFRYDGGALLVGENEGLSFDTSGGSLRRGRDLEGHDGYVSAVAFDAGGKRAATGASDGDVQLWDLGAGKPIRRLDRHRDTVTSLAFRPDGKWLLSSADDGATRLTSLDGPDRTLEMRAVKGTDDTYAFTLGPEGRVELFGDAARAHLFCRIGAATYPFDLCRERFETPGLVARVLAGDDAYLVP